MGDKKQPFKGKKGSPAPEGPCEHCIFCNGSPYSPKIVCVAMKHSDCPFPSNWSGMHKKGAQRGF